MISSRRSRGALTLTSPDPATAPKIDFGLLSDPEGYDEAVLLAGPLVERALVVVCRTGGRAALSALNLQRLGFADVRSIAGGVLAWGEAGLPLIAR